MKRRVCIIVICLCAIVLTACGGSASKEAALQETVSGYDQSLDKIFNDPSNTSDGIEYRGYEIDGKNVRFDITIEGAAAYYVMGDDMSDIESIIDDYCSEIYQQLKPYEYNALFFLLSDVGDDGVLYASLNGETLYSITDGIADIYSDSYTDSSSEDNNSSSITGSDRIESDIEADTWYTQASNTAVQWQNAEVTDVVPMSQGKAFMVTYYPVCKSCHVCGPTIQMTGVSADSPVTETYYCQSCGVITYCLFEVAY